jgi:hypothetical protein
MKIDGEFSLFVTIERLGQTRRYREKMTATGDLVEGDIRSENIAKQRIGKQRMQASIVVQKARCTFGYVETPCEVVVSEIFKRKSRIGLSDFRERRKPEQPTDFPNSSGVGRGSP